MSQINPFSTLSHNHSGCDILLIKRGWCDSYSALDISRGRYIQYKGNINGFKWWRKSKVIIEQSPNSVVKVIEETTGRVQFKLQHETRVVQMQCSPKKNLLLTKTKGGIVRVWDLKTGRLRCQLTMQDNGSMTALCFNRHGKLTLNGVCNPAGKVTNLIKNHKKVR